MFIFPNISSTLLEIDIVLPVNCTRGAGAPESPRVPNYCFAVWCVLILSSVGETGE